MLKNELICTNLNPQIRHATPRRFYRKIYQWEVPSFEITKYVDPVKIDVFLISDKTGNCLKSKKKTIYSFLVADSDFPVFYCNYRNYRIQVFFDVVKAQFTITHKIYGIPGVHSSSEFIKNVIRKCTEKRKQADDYVRQKYKEYENKHKEREEGLRKSSCVYVNHESKLKGCEQCRFHHNLNKPCSLDQVIAADFSNEFLDQMSKERVKKQLESEKFQWIPKDLKIKLKTFDENTFNQIMSAIKYKTSFSTAYNVRYPLGRTRGISQGDAIHVNIEKSNQKDSVMFKYGFGKPQEKEPDYVLNGSTIRFGSYMWDSTD